ncbi:MAG: enoyl-CoA hydratase [Alphaproteobacteria bacterium]|nr:enoyl-CoA hydratase [Alphaproteobacteria bacterium]
MTTDLLVSVDDGVATLTLNRPQALNALSRDMGAAMLEALTRFELDSSVGAIVLTGAGRAFCAGGDVRAMAGRADQEPEPLEQKIRALRRRMEVSRLLHEINKPTIAMLNGVAAGAGLSMALACDLRYAARSARMTTAFAKVGYSGDFGGTYFLSRIVGTARARELYYFSDMVDSARMESLGLANAVFDDDKLVAETMALAKRLAHGPRVAISYMKRNFNVAEDGNLEDSFDTEANGHSRTSETEDHKEASKAFVEKRPAVFKGR